MKKKELLELGFKKFVDKEYYYYTYDFKDAGNLWLFTNLSTERKKKEWAVYCGDQQKELTKEQIITLIQIFN